MIRLQELLETIPNSNEIYIEEYLPDDDELVYGWFVDPNDEEKREQVIKRCGKYVVRKIYSAVGNVGLSAIVIEASAFVR